MPSPLRGRGERRPQHQLRRGRPEHQRVPIDRWLRRPSGTDLLGQQQWHLLDQLSRLALASEHDELVRIGAWTMRAYLLYARSTRVLVVAACAHSCWSSPRLSDELLV